MCWEIFGPGFGADCRQAQLLESGRNGCAGSLEPEPLTPELSVAASAEANYRTGTVVLMLEADIANDLSRLGVDHSPQAQLIISIEEVDLCLHPFARLGDIGRQL